MNLVIVNLDSVLAESELLLIINAINSYININNDNPYESQNQALNSRLTFDLSMLVKLIYSIVYHYAAWTPPRIVDNFVTTRWLHGARLREFLHETRSIL